METAEIILAHSRKKAELCLHWEHLHLKIKSKKNNGKNCLNIGIVITYSIPRLGIKIQNQIWSMEYDPF